MASRSKSHGRKHTMKAKHAAKRPAKRTAHKKAAKRPVKRTQKKGSWLSWIPFMKGGAATGGAHELAPGAVDASSTLLSADMHGKPTGVDAEHVAPVHATSGGARNRKERNSRKERKHRDSRKQRSLRRQRGGMAPLNQAYTMLLSAADAARAGLSAEWPASN